MRYPMLGRSVMRRAWLPLAVMVLAAPRAARPQGGTLLGPEFRVNSYITDVQNEPEAAADPAGNFMVVWTSAGEDGSSLGVFGQRFGGSGTPLGSEFRVNTYTTDLQSRPSVAADGTGTFVVAWSSRGGYGGTPADVFGQRFASAGAPLGPEFRVNVFTTNGQDRPAVAADAAGNFVVVWTSFDQDGSNLGVFGQRFASSGSPVGPEFRVNTYTTGYQHMPSVAADSAGSFVVVWTNGGGYSGPPGEIFGQRYAADGTPVGSEFRVNTSTTGGLSNPDVATGVGGSFVVVWQGFIGASIQDILGQRFTGSGAPAGPEFRVNAGTALQYAPSVAADASGNFVVAWTSSGGYGGTPGDVFGQRYASDGVPFGTEFRVNSFTTSSQNRAAVAADPVGNFVVTWDSFGQDGSSTGVFGQRYAGIVPVTLLRFGVE